MPWKWPHRRRLAGASLFAIGLEAKSFIVASALLDHSTTAEEAIRLAQLEEDFQIERGLASASRWASAQVGAWSKGITT